MKKFNFFYLVCVALCIVSSGCGAMNFNQMISKRLDTEMLHSKLETQKTDLSVDSKCPDTRSLGVVNGESNTDQYCINNSMGGCRWYVIPKDFTNDIVKYIENRLRENNIKVGSGSDIIVSLEELKSQEGVWTFGSDSKLKINVPEINYTRTYTGESGSPLGDYAAAYAIHLSVENFFKDPVIQGYLKCY